MANSSFSLEVAYDVTHNGGLIDREHMHIKTFRFNRLQSNKSARLFHENNNNVTFNEYRFKLKKFLNYKNMRYVLNCNFSMGQKIMMLTQGEKIYNSLLNSFNEEVISGE